MSAVGDLIITFGITLGGAVALVRTIDYFRERRHRPRVRTIIQSHKNMEIIGDGPWTLPSEKIPRSALIRHMPEPGM